jgi:hypothetical protein
MLNKKKCHFLTKTVDIKENMSCLGVGGMGSSSHWWIPVEGGGDIRKGSRRVSIVEIFCIHLCK